MLSKLIFANPSSFTGEGFGCASFGFKNSPDPFIDEVREYPIEIKGDVFSGNLDDVLLEIPTKEYKAGIVLFGNCGRENDFIHKLHNKVKCPLVGGAAAFNPSIGKTGLVSGNGEVSILLIDDDRFEFDVEFKNIHCNLLGIHKIGFTDTRVIETIDDEPALKWYTEQRKKYGFSNDDFEHMTFSDLNGVNCHMSLANGKLVSGRDLCETMIFRYVNKGDVYPQMKAFYNDPNAITFGCAGLKGILESDIMGDGLGLFMFGEVVTANGLAEFGNLSLSKLIIK